VRKTTVLAHYANDTHQVAAALGITRQAVEQWPDIVPEGSAYKLQAITAGDLKVDPALYAKKKARAA
jgi:transcriptional regulator with XRE-family HTH domain